MADPQEGAQRRSVADGSTGNIDAGQSQGMLAVPAVMKYAHRHIGGSHRTRRQCRWRTGPGGSDVVDQAALQAVAQGLVIRRVQALEAQQTSLYVPGQGGRVLGLDLFDVGLDLFGPRQGLARRLGPRRRLFGLLHQHLGDQAELTAIARHLESLALDPRVARRSIDTVKEPARVRLDALRHEHLGNQAELTAIARHLESLALDPRVARRSIDTVKEPARVRLDALRH